MKKVNKENIIEVRTDLMDPQKYLLIELKYKEILQFIEKMGGYILYKQLEAYMGSKKKGNKLANDLVDENLAGSVLLNNHKYLHLKEIAIRYVRKKVRTSRAKPKPSHEVLFSSFTRIEYYLQHRELKDADHCILYRDKIDDLNFGLYLVQPLKKFEGFTEKFRVKMELVAQIRRQVTIKEKIAERIEAGDKDTQKLSAEYQKVLDNIDVLQQDNEVLDEELRHLVNDHIYAMRTLENLSLIKSEIKSLSQSRCFLKRLVVHSEPGHYRGVSLSFVIIDIDRSERWLLDILCRLTRIKELFAGDVNVGVIILTKNDTRIEVVKSLIEHLDKENKRRKSSMERLRRKGNRSLYEKEHAKSYDIARVTYENLNVEKYLRNSTDSLAYVKPEDVDRILKIKELLEKE